MSRIFFKKLRQAKSRDFSQLTFTARANRGAEWLACAKGHFTKQITNTQLGHGE